MKNIEESYLKEEKKLQDAINEENKRILGNQPDKMVGGYLRQVFNSDGSTCGSYTGDYNSLVICLAQSIIDLSSVNKVPVEQIEVDVMAMVNHAIMNGVQSRVTIKGREDDANEEEKSENFS